MVPVINPHAPGRRAYHAVRCAQELLRRAGGLADDLVRVQGYSRAAAMRLTIAAMERALAEMQADAAAEVAPRPPGEQ